MLSMRSLVWVGHAVTYMLLCSAGGRVSVLVKHDDGLTWPRDISSRVVSGFSNTHGKRPLSLLSHNPADKLSPLTTLMSTRGGIRRGGERCAGGQSKSKPVKGVFCRKNAGSLTAPAGFRSATCLAPRAPASRIRWTCRR